MRGCCVCARPGALVGRHPLAASKTQLVAVDCSVLLEPFLSFTPGSFGDSRRHHQQKVGAVSEALMWWILCVCVCVCVRVCCVLFSLRLVSCLTATAAAGGWTVSDYVYCLFGLVGLESRSKVATRRVITAGSLWCHRKWVFAHSSVTMPPVRSSPPPLVCAAFLFCDRAVIKECVFYVCVFRRGAGVLVVCGVFGFVFSG